MEIDGGDIENLHELLDVVERELRRLRLEERTEIDVLEDAGDLCLVIGEILGWSSAYVSDIRTLGVSPTLLNKFAKLRGRIKTRDAIAVAERVRSHLRSLDQRFSETPRTPSAQTLRTQLLTERREFSATRWVAVGSSPTIKGKISALAILLESIIQQVQGANLPPSQQALTTLEKAQLIAILETALNVLKSPYAEKSIIEKAKGELEDAAKTAARKGVQQGLGRLSGLAVEKIAELISNIF